MLNPLRVIDRAVDGYMSFWENTSARDKVWVHLETFCTALLFRSQFKVKLDNVVPIYETTALVALAAHVVMAILTGIRAEKKPGPQGYFDSLTLRLKGLEQSITALQSDIWDIKNRLNFNSADEV